jgi:two-component system KDP operon response regulator KdpE
MNQRILVVDDEPQIRKFLRISLTAQGYDVLEAPGGEDGISKCATDQPNLVILDLGLPDLDGQQVINRIREWSNVPIIVLSVRASDGEKVNALDSGANDYVTKPFSIKELLARIRVAMRAGLQGEGGSPELVVGELVVDVPRHKVFVSGERVRLTRKEFELLKMLAQNAGRIVTHRQILRELWGPAHEDDVHYLRIYIGHLRQKLGDDSANPQYIESEPGVGYRLIMDAA